MEARNRSWDITDLVVTYGPSLRRYFRRRVRPSDAEDLVQEVFLKLQGCRARDPVENTEKYLFSTARNVLIDHMRDQSSHSATLHDEWCEKHDMGDLLSPERIAIGHEEYQCVLRAIVNLPPRAREAFELHRFGNLTYQAIGQQMGIHKDSVKDLMHRALLRIAEELDASQ